jgi:hypothetical protein
VKNRGRTSAVQDHAADLLFLALDATAAKNHGDDCAKIKKFPAALLFATVVCRIL